MKKIAYNIKMQCGDNAVSEPVEGFEIVRNVLAVRNNGANKWTSPRHKWTLDHLPTGFRVAVFKTKSQAVNCGLELFKNPEVKAFLIGGGETLKAKEASAIIIYKHLW